MNVVRIVTETERLILRTEARGDQAQWLAHMNDARVMARLGGPRSPEKVAENFRRRAEGWAKWGWSFMMLERKADGVLIGHCGLSAIETDCAPACLRGQMQIGWLLRADCWGQGYAREAAEAVRDMAFARWSAPILYAQTSADNLGSWGLMEKLGMARRADLDYPDPDYPPEDNPTMVYALTRADWQARRKDPA